MVRDNSAHFDVAEQWYDKGVAHHRLKRYEQALACFDRALALAPNESSWWYWKGKTLCDLLRYEEALACFERALEIAPDNASAADFRAFCLFKLDRDEEALVAYDQALALAPTSGNLWYWKGRTLFWLKRDEEALACFDRAIERASDKSERWHWKGLTLARLNRDEEALGCFGRALALAPRDVAAAWQRAAALFRLQRNGEALEAYHTALALAAPDQRAPLRHWIAETLHRLKRDEEALAVYDEALASDANHADWWCGRARACFDLKRYEEGLANAERSIALDAGYADGWMLQELHLYGLGRYQEALAANDHAIELAPADAQVWWNRGATLYALSRFEEAAAAYDEALRLNPGDPDLQRRYTASMATIRRAATDQRLKLRDGRWLGYLDIGDPDGAPIICCHGAPGSRLSYFGDDALLKELRIRLIIPDRPGCGLSDFQPRRRLLDWPADIEQLADHLSLARFAMLGISAGGPHAAACALAIPHRLTRVGLVSSAAPPELAPPIRALPPGERISNVISRYFPWPIERALYAPLVWLFRRMPRLLLASAYARAAPMPDAPDAPDAPDVPDVTDGADTDTASEASRWDASGPLPPIVREELLEPVRRGARGFAWDVRLCAHDWGFQPAALRGVEVHLWHGERDPLVVATAARALADAIPGCRATFYPGEGHDVYARHLRAILTTLAPEAASAAAKVS